MRKKLNAKKILLIFILLANVVFICLKSDTFQSEFSQSMNCGTEEQLVGLSQDTITIVGDMVVEQDFFI